MAFSQFNFKVGYIGLFPNLDKTNNLLTQYNDFNNPGLKYDKIKYLHGIDIGGRYIIGNTGIELGWFNAQSKKVKTQGVITDDWKVSLSGFYLGIERYYKNFGLGASIEYNRMRYKSKIEGISGSETVLSDQFLSSKIYLLTSASSGSTAISIKPFFIPKWNPINIASVQDEIISNGPEGPINEYINGFGITVVIYNGPQD